MKFSFAAIAACMASCVAAAPQAVPVPETNFEFSMAVRDLELGDLAGYVEELSSMISKRDEATVESILTTVNESGIVWELLDSISESPAAVKNLANITSSLIRKVNITKLITSALSGKKSSAALNTSAILAAVKQSGLIESTIQGTLLDTSFQPVIAKLIEGIVKSNEDLILYAYTALTAKKSKRAESTSNSLQSFVGNLASSILSSSTVDGAIADTLNALNDTGIFVYVVKRFLTTPAYLNMTNQIVSGVVSSGAIDVSGLTSLYKSFNLTEIILAQLKNSDQLVSLITGVLSGQVSTSSLTSSLGSYGPAFKNIVKILEDDGLFVELNDLLFGGDSNSNSKVKKDESSSNSTTHTNGTTTKSSSSAGAAGALYSTPSYLAAGFIGALLMI